MTNPTSTAKRAPAKKTTPAKKTAPAAVKAAPKKAAPKPRAATVAAEMGLPTAGWYLDPTDETTKRWWDGTTWDGPAVGVNVPTGDGPLPLAMALPTTPAPTAKPKQVGDEPDPETRPITFMGRSMLVVRPGPGVLAVWARTAKRFQRLGNQPDQSGEAHVDLLSRAVGIFESLLASEVDQDWFEEQLLTSKLTLQQAAQLVTISVDAWSGDKPQAAAPTTGPAPRVRRGSRG